jgi:carboxypeptidase family protein
MKRIALLLLLVVAGLLVWLATTEILSTSGPSETSTEPASEASRETDRAPEPPRRRRRSGGGDEAQTEPALEGAGEEEGIPWTVIVKAPDGSRVPGVLIQTTEWFRADADGVVAVGSFPVNTSSVTATTKWGATLTLTEPVSEIVTPDTVPLSVTLVDGETGTPLGGRVFLEVAGDRNVALAPTSGGFLLENAPVFRGADPSLRFVVEPPQGYANESTYQPRITTRVSRFAERYHVTIPVRPTCSVRVHVKLHDGTPAAGAAADNVIIGGKWLPFEKDARADAKGVLDVRGIPFLRGERYAVTASKGEVWAVAEAVEVLRPELVPETAVTLPKDPPNGSIGLGGGSGSAFSSRGRPPRITAGLGRIEVSVVRRNGRPAIDTNLTLNGRRNARTDRFGRAVFEGLGPARYTVAVSEPGFTGVRKRVEVADGATAYCDLTEPDGTTLRIRVEDADGAPVPFAQVFPKPLGGAPLAVVVDGVQLALFHTDESGVCAIPHLAANRLHVRAHYGSRRGAATWNADTTLTVRLAR